MNDENVYSGVVQTNSDYSHQTVYPGNSGYYNTQQSNPQPVKKAKRGFMPKLMATIALGLCFGLCAGLGFYAVNEITAGSSRQSGIENTEVAALKQSLSDLEKTVLTTNGVSARNVSTVVTDVTEVVDRVMPSMVSVTNLYEERMNYFGRTYSQEAEASGSGIIIGENDEELLIATNYHVVQDCVQLTVQFADDSQVAALVKGYDSTIDVAVIAVQKSDITDETKAAISVASMGDSDALKIGEPAIAIGNALGYGQSVTTGVISALNRDIEMENTSHSLIQTNAAINPGNSGGALLNIKGEVIGINSNKIGGTTVEGMGYAIPISEAKPIIEELMTRETRVKVNEDEKGYIGIAGATVDATTIETYGIPEGVYVNKVYERSAAAQAGMIKGDVIVKVDDVSVTTLEDLQGLLSYYKGGTTVKVTIMRAGVEGYSEMVLDVTLGTKAQVID